MPFDYYAKEIPRTDSRLSAPPIGEKSPVWTNLEDITAGILPGVTQNLRSARIFLRRNGALQHVPHRLCKITINKNKYLTVIIASQTFRLVLCTMPRVAPLHP